MKNTMKLCLPTDITEPDDQIIGEVMHRYVRPLVKEITRMLKRDFPGAEVDEVLLTLGALNAFVIGYFRGGQDAQRLIVERVDEILKNASKVVQ